MESLYIHKTESEYTIPKEYNRSLLLSLTSVYTWVRDIYMNAGNEESSQYSRNSREPDANDDDVIVGATS